MESPASTQSAVTRCGRFVSYAGITRETPTCSFPNAVGRSAPSASIASSSVSGRPPRCHSRSTHTCFAMPAGLSWPTTATTRGPCSTTSGTRTFSTPSDTPKWRPTDSRIFGGTDDGRAGSIAPHGRSSRSKKTTRHIFRSRARWRSDLAWHALPRADRGVGLQHHSVLGFRRIEQWTVPYLYRFYHPLDHFDRTACLRFKRGLDVFDHGLKLLVRQLLEQIAVLDLVLAGN